MDLTYMELWRNCDEEQKRLVAATDPASLLSEIDVALARANELLGLRASTVAEIRNFVAQAQEYVKIIRG